MFRGATRARWWVLAVSAGSALACAGAPTQTYPGPARPDSEVAVLRGTSRANVIDIDGVDASGSTWALLPGPHEVLLRVRIYTEAPNMHWTIETWCRVSFETAAGGSYQAVVRHSEETAPGIDERVKMEIGVADADGALAGISLGCTPKDPRRERSR